MNEIFLDCDRSFIGSWIIDDLSVCDKLIDLFESSDDKVQGTSYSGPEKGFVVNKTVKDSIDLVLRNYHSEAQSYVNCLGKVVEAYKQKFEYCDKTGPWTLESANIQKYSPGGGFFPWHSERTSAVYPMVLRHLVFMTYLNDVTDGGETEFFYQKIKIQPKKGLTLIWPADWTHTHRGLPSQSQTKYIVTGWYKFVDNIPR